MRKKSMKTVLLGLVCITSFNLTACSDDISTLPNQESINSVIDSGSKTEETQMMGIFSQTMNASSTDLFPSDASASDIQQSLRPVCYFLSALAGLANLRPEEVKKLIVENPDGNSFTVKFPGLPSSKNVITVNRDELTDFGVYINKGKNGSIWASVAIKAIAKYWSKNGLVRFLKSKSDAADWGGAWEGIEIVTGNVADFMLVNLNTNDRILSKIDTALKAKKLVSVSTFGKGNKNPKKVGEYKLSSAHVLTAISVDTINKTVTIRDPYGKVSKVDIDGAITEDRSTDGVMTLPINDFRKYFADIAIETNKKSNFLSRLRFLK